MKSTNIAADEKALEMVNTPGIRSTADMARELSDFYDEPYTTSYGRVQRAYKKLNDIDKVARPYRKKQTIEAICVMIQQCWQNYMETQVAAHAAAAGGFINQLAKIDGMYAAERVEIEDKRLPVEDMTPHQQRQYLKGALQNPEVRGLLGLDKVIDVPSDDVTDSEDAES